MQARRTLSRLIAPLRKARPAGAVARPLSGLIVRKENRPAAGPVFVHNLCIFYLTMTLSRCQISSTYSWIVRSEENLPAQAVFIRAMRVHFFSSR